MLKIAAVQKFLAERSPLASLYTPEMEVQVNVVSGPERVNGDYMGKPWHGWRDPATGEEWKAFRIPWQADRDPQYRDKPIRWNLEKYVEAVGLTGWNWVKRQSHWVAFDIDALVDHVKSSGLSSKQIDDVKDRLMKLDWVTIRRSKGGQGLHVYVHFDPPVADVANHTQHACIARAVLSQMSAEVGCDMKQAVDKLGGNMWIWHKDTKPGGFTLLKEGQPTQPPINWRDHIDVVEGKSFRVKTGDPDAQFESLIEKIKHVQLDPEHQRLLAWFRTEKVYAVWDSDRHMLVCHTSALKKAHEELRMRGIFYTNSTGKNGPNDYNCFMFPLRRGAWVVRRFGINTREHAAWSKDKKGWTKCLLNAPADLPSASIAHGGVENKDEEFIFPTALKMMAALRDLGAPILELDDGMKAREGRLGKHKTPGRVLVRIKRETADPGMEGWLSNKKGDWWERMLTVETETEEQEPPDEILRHVTSGQSDAGWFVAVKGDWVLEPKTNVLSVTDAMGMARPEANKLLGLAILNPWELVAEPFQDEYLPNRRWNRDAAQLAFKPNAGPHPTWDKIIYHTFGGLSEAVKSHPWCQAAGMVHGGDYGRVWLASLFQEPKTPLPYLFFWGPQNSGKSILWEALSCLFANPRRGLVRADRALKDQNGFNGELAGAVLCVVEETDVRQSKDAYNRIKDWVTGLTIAIRDLYKKTYDVQNTTHWMQFANEPSHCPVMPGDTRITVCHVAPPETEENKYELLAKCKDEAPAFLHTLLKVEIPRLSSRLRVPVLETEDKHAQQEANKNELAQFVDDHCLLVPGASVRISEFLEKFLESMLPDQRRWWTQSRVARQLAALQVPKGRMGGEGYYWYGNISFDRNTKPGRVLTLSGDRLVPSAGTPAQVADGHAVVGSNGQDHGP